LTLLAWATVDAPGLGDLGVEGGLQRAVIGHLAGGDARGHGLDVAEEHVLAVGRQGLDGGGPFGLQHGVLDPAAKGGAQQ
jgi:hypothetical protein